MDEWPEMDLGECGVAVLDCVHATPKGVPDGYPYIAIPNIVEGKISLAGVRRISQEDWQRWTKKTLPQPGDVIATRRGRVGDTAVVPAGLECAIGQNLVILRSDGSVIDPSFLGWLTRGPDWRREVERWLNVGAVFDSLNVADFPRFRFRVPPMHVQRRIAAVLGAIDDLIETNERLIDRLRSSARTLVAQGCQQDSTRTTVGVVAAFENRKRVPLSADQRARMPGDYPYYGANGQMGTVGDYIFDEPRVLVGEDGTVVNADGSPVVNYVWGRYWVNNHAHVLKGLGCSTEMLRISLAAASVSAFVTGAVQAKLNMGNLKSVPILLPVNPQVDSAVQSLAGAERGLVSENADLLHTRNELLPLLMSGRMSPGEVDLGV